MKPRHVAAAGAVAYLVAALVAVVGMTTAAHALAAHITLWPRAAVSAAELAASAMRMMQ